MCVVYLFSLTTLGVVQSCPECLFCVYFSFSLSLLFHNFLFRFILIAKQTAYLLLLVDFNIFILACPQNDTVFILCG